MKNISKALLLFASIPLLLASCGKSERKAYFLETSNTFEYVDGMCYQAYRSDIVETIYVINLPINPEANPSEYQYDVTFIDDVKNIYVTLTDGLEGKKVNSVFKIADNILKININKICQNEEATWGYIKINKRAFTAHTKRADDVNICAYVAIGDHGKELVNKPTINDDGTIVQ